MNHEMSPVRLSPAGAALKRVLAAAIVVLVFIVSARVLQLDFAKFFTRLGNAPEVLGRLMTVDFSDFGEMLFALGTSIALAFAALVAGAILSMLLSFLAARNVTPSKFLSKCIVSIIAVVRAVPALVWVLMVVASIGFGNTGGMIGLMFPVVGYLTKSFTASIEDLGDGLVEALRSTGATRLNIIMKGVLPTVFPAFMSWIAIRGEANVAESISLGMVGISGIGMLLSRAVTQYNYGKITSIILLIFTTMVVMEFLMNHVRKKIRER
jgi:phosphonate transport system permease protein